MVLFLIVIPAALIVAAAVAAWLSVRGSSLRITAAGVEIRNHRQPVRVVPLADVDRFEAPPPVGFLPSARPHTAVLVLRDGSRLAVRSLAAPEAGAGIAALNDRVQALRRGSR